MADKIIDEKIQIVWLDGMKKKMVTMQNHSSKNDFTSRRPRRQLTKRWNGLISEETKLSANIRKTSER